MLTTVRTCVFLLCSQGSTRARVWKILLQIGPDDLDSREYLEYVSRGPSEVSAKSESQKVSQSMDVPTDHLVCCGNLGSQKRHLSNTSHRLGLQRSCKGRHAREIAGGVCLASKGSVAASAATVGGKVGQCQRQRTRDAVELRAR